MTREERIRYLKGLLKCELCEEESTKICSSCDNRRIGSSAKCYDALEEVIKMLEQGDVLDKIRAEIDDATEIHSDGEFYIKNIDVKRIIDKYKAGSGDK